MTGAHNVRRTSRTTVGLALLAALAIGAAGCASGVANQAPSSAAAPSSSGSTNTTPSPSGSPRHDEAGVAVDKVESITPDPLHAREDVPSVYGAACQQNEAGSEAVSCIRGDEQGRTTVAVVGDSKVVQWLPALEKLASKNGWKLVIYGKSGCAFAAAVTSGLSGSEPYQSCVTWNQNVMDKLTAEKPDYVITSQGKGTALVNRQKVGTTAGREALADGLRTRWSQLVEAGIGVVVIRDTPYPGMQVDLCVSEHMDKLTECTYERNRGMAGGGGLTQLAALEGSRGVNFIDLNNAICPAEQCPPVIGNVLVYRQGSHITATFARTLAPRLESALASAGLAIKDG